MKSIKPRQILSMVVYAALCIEMLLVSIKINGVLTTFNSPTQLAEDIGNGLFGFVYNSFSGIFVGSVKIVTSLLYMLGNTALTVIGSTLLNKFTLSGNPEITNEELDTTRLFYNLASIATILIALIVTKFSAVLTVLIAFAPIPFWFSLIHIDKMNKLANRGSKFSLSSIVEQVKELFSKTKDKHPKGYTPPQGSSISGFQNGVPYQTGNPFDNGNMPYQNGNPFQNNMPYQNGNPFQNPGLPMPPPMSDDYYDDVDYIDTDYTDV